MTHQTGHVLTPKASPDDREVAFLDGTTFYVSWSGRSWMAYLSSRSTPPVRRTVLHESCQGFRLHALHPGSTGHPTLSPDGKWIAQALTDGFSTNIWALSTSTGEWRKITDFAGRPTFIARRVSWSSDGRSVLAAIAEGDADIVLLDGLANAGRD